MNAGELILFLKVNEGTPNYYEIVTQIARMVDDPRISLKRVKHEAERFQRNLGVTLDMNQLEQAYKEFKKAGLSRAAHGRS